MILLETDKIYLLMERDNIACYELFENQKTEADLQNDDIQKSPLVKFIGENSETAINHLKETFATLFTHGTFVIRLKTNKNSKNTEAKIFQINVRNLPSATLAAIPAPSNLNGLGEIESNLDFINKLKHSFREDFKNEIEVLKVQAGFEIERMKLMWELEKLREENRDLNSEIKDRETTIKQMVANKDNMSTEWSTIIAKSAKQIAKEVPQLKGLFANNEPKPITNNDIEL